MSGRVGHESPPDTENRDCQLEHGDHGHRERGQMVKVVTKTTLHAQDDELEYWLSRPMSERIAAVEILRQRVYGGGDGTRQGLQRVVNIIHRSPESVPDDRNLQ
ncbi:MAG: hypothetical protein ACKOI2_12595 [Actinomycetota bacterium]